MSGGATAVGPIRLNARGSVSGRIVFLDPDHYATALVAVPELGIVARPNARGGYLLQGVAAGQREVVLIHRLYASSPPIRTVQLKSLANVVAADFVRRPPAGESALVDFGTVIKGAQPSAAWQLWNPDGVSAAVDQAQLTGTDAARFTLGLASTQPLTVPATGLEIPLPVDTSLEGAFHGRTPCPGHGRDGDVHGERGAEGDGRTTSYDPGSGHSNDAGRAQLRLTSRGTRDGGRRAPQRRRPGTVQRTIAPPLFQLVGNPFPLSMAPGAKAQVSVKALNLGTSGAVTAFLKLTWQPGLGTLDVKLTVSWSSGS